MRKILAQITKLEWLVMALVVVFAVFMRTNRLEGKLTFEWDQSRDLQAVASMLETGRPALLGPIVRGDVGGFYLGPAYYYLITPLYLGSGGNPLALAVVSVGADTLLIIFLYLYLRRRTSRLSALAVSLVWAGSPLLIRNAYTPWNVSLIPLWCLGFVWTLERLKDTPRLRYQALLIFLASLTTNIHVSLIPVAGLFVLLHWHMFKSRTVKAYIALFLAAFIPVSTLVLHDLTHKLENTIILKRFLAGTGSTLTSFSEIIPLIIEKFGYTVGRLFTGEPMTILGLTLVILLAVYGFINRRKSVVLQSSLITIAAILFSLLVYRDTDFAEYYFLPTFVPIILLSAYLFNALPKFIKFFGLASLLVFYLQLGIMVRNEPISPFSLTVKKEVIHKIKSLDYPVEVRTNLPRERNTGFDYLMKDLGVTSDPSAARKAYIYEADNLEVIAPPEARSIILDQPIQAFKLIIFSN